MERMCQRRGSDQTPTLLFESKNHVSIHLYNTILAKTNSDEDERQHLREMQLEQLERLRSENDPHRPMITHTINSYQIPNQII